MLASGINLVTTVIGFGMSVTFIIFVCTRLFCGRIRAPDSRPVFDTEMRSEEHTINGLEPVVVAAFPTMKFNREAFRSTEDAQCSICLGEYQDKEILRMMPKCGHIFHVTCIDVWLQKQSTCPVCRLSLHDSVEAKHLRSPMFTTILQSGDSSEFGSDHSYQWLLPSHEFSAGSESNQGHGGSVPRDLESSHAGAETGR
ncbi:RING-H2 finger protein ATL39-like [Tasmannia lanceolata]|uniref:RING-H2 finger protein ATL39-like n=1 Tax=Tasmannia lanceolata TaxID=3420 RepID=UPI004063DCED